MKKQIRKHCFVVCFFDWCSMTFQTIYPREMEERIKKERALVLDIRTREEYSRGHWPGAQNRPYDLVDRWEKTLPGNRLLILYCEHGGSSMQLARRLGLEGYRAASVIGGYQEIRRYQQG